MLIFPCFSAFNNLVKVISKQHIMLLFSASLRLRVWYMSELRVTWYLLAASHRFGSLLWVACNKDRALSDVDSRIYLSPVMSTSKYLGLYVFSVHVWVMVWGTINNVSSLLNWIPLINFTIFTRLLPSVFGFFLCSPKGVGISSDFFNCSNR